MAYGRQLCWVTQLDHMPATPGMECHYELFFFANFLHSPSAVRKSNIENSSMTSTSALRTFATWIVPLSILLLQSVSSPKKLCRVVPSMRCAATPLGASFKTTKCLDCRSSMRRQDFLLPAGPNMTTLICLPAVS